MYILAERANNPGDHDDRPTSVFDWSEFWQAPGTLSAFWEGPLAESYYQTDCQQNLVRLFDRLAGQRSAAGRVLDAGCGNGAGATSLLAAADRRQQVLNIDAIDSAVISPPNWLEFRVRFRKGFAEKLDYPDDTFELVLSCFGLEFFDRAAFLSECHRVLKPGGEIAFLTYASESPMLLMQSRYIRVYENGLRQLMDTVSMSQKPETELLAKIRCHIEEDVPQPHFRVHLNQIVDGLTSLSSEGTGDLFRTDRLFLPDVNGKENMYSFQSLSRFFRLMHVIHHAALSAPVARDLVRRIDHSGFDECCVMPLEFQGMLLCWLFTAEKQTPAKCS
jgi:ubiquinone/menaquinone biosynthesis C-methylase UbiE